MTKRNKIVLISIGVIIPITILTITLPIVLVKKADDKKKLDALNKKKEEALKKEKEEALKIFNNKKLRNLDDKIKNRILKFDVDLDLSKSIDRVKIIDEIHKLNKLTPEEKKLISVNVKNGIITNFTNNVGVKITINSVTTKDITFKIQINRVTLKNSNIKNGDRGIIFQDSSGNIWSMGNSKLQVLEKGHESKGWQSSTAVGLTKNSNIKNGGNGIIFQDLLGNIWSSSSSSGLQVLKKDKKDEGWKSLNDKSIFYSITMINDKAGNIWATGANVSLYVLESGKEDEGWKTDDSGLTKGSNIIDGQSGTIFQDSSGNIWSMGLDSKLQVLESGKKNEGWKDGDSGLTKGSKIKKGQFGTIFQDVLGNIWSMGEKSQLQVLEKGKENDGWKTGDSGLTKGSKIIDGEGGTVFQDSSGNIWSMGGYNSKLQVLESRKKSKGWQNSIDSGLTKGSNIVNGINGAIFQDSSGNIWSMGLGSKLQVLEKGNESKGWQSSKTSGLTNGSNIIDGQFGRIFQDSSGNIWSMSRSSKLQVLKKGSSKWIDT